MFGFFKRIYCNALLSDDDHNSVVYYNCAMWNMPDHDWHLTNDDPCSNTLQGNWSVL